MKRNHQFSRNEEVDELPKFSLGGNGSFIEINYGDKINFQPNDGVTLTRTVSTNPVTGVVTHTISIAASGGGGGGVQIAEGTNITIEVDPETGAHVINGLPTGFFDHTVLKGSNYGKLSIEPFNDPALREIKAYQGTQPRVYSYSNSTDEGNVTIENGTGLHFFFVSSVGNKGVNLVDNTNEVFEIPADRYPKVKPGGTVMIVTSGWSTSDLSKRRWTVFGDLYEVSGEGFEEGTVEVTTSITLDAALHNRQTLICRNPADITITIPAGLGKNFTCNVVAENIGTRLVNFANATGTTLTAPHGKKLLDGYTCNILKETSKEVFNLQGELVP